MHPQQVGEPGDAAQRFGQIVPGGVGELREVLVGAGQLRVGAFQVGGVRGDHRVGLDEELDEAASSSSRCSATKCSSGPYAVRRTAHTRSSPASTYRARSSPMDRGFLSNCAGDSSKDTNSARCPRAQAASARDAAMQVPPSRRRRTPATSTPGTPRRRAALRGGQTIRPERPNNSTKKPARTRLVSTTHAVPSTLTGAVIVPVHVMRNGGMGSFAQ